MSSPRSSTDSERRMGIPLAIASIEFKTYSGKTRIQAEYDDGKKEIIKDICDSKFAAPLLAQGSTTMERITAKASLKMFSRFLLEHSVGVSEGFNCWNMFCSGRDCGIKAPLGMLFAPPEDIEFYGNIASSPEEQGHYKTHLSTPIYHKGKLTNRIKLRKGLRYLIAGHLETIIRNNNVSPRTPLICECEQCTEGGISRDFAEAVINPLEILSQRYQSTQVGGLGIWRPMRRALVCRDKGGTYRIRGYISPFSYSEFICDRCKSAGKVARCENDCLKMICAPRDGPDVDLVESGSTAVLGTILEFCPARFKKLRKALNQVAGKLDLLGANQGGPVLSKIANLVSATRTEVVFVLNNDTSLVQPVISGANCFLRRDMRGMWDSCETLTGAELNKQIFFVDQAGSWIMVGSGDKYGVSSADSGKYHLELGGQSMVYGAHLDNQQFR